MDTVNDVTKTLSDFPLTNFAFLVVLAGFGLAAWAIYVVHQHTKQKPRR